MTEKDYKPKHHEKGMNSQKPQPKPESKDVKGKEKEVPVSISNNRTDKANQSVVADNKNNQKSSDKKEEPKVPEKEKKKDEKPKKEEAVAKGLNLHASKKHCMYISSFIKAKPIDRAINELQEVIKMKRAIPFKGEIPHRKGNLMSGRYPIKASKQIIYVLKALRGNVLVNGLDLEKARIYFASASWASRPAKKGGMRFKRVNLILKAKEFPAQEIQEKK